MVESFGARLKREREKKGISLDDISLSTKIGTRLLRALEEEHFEQLPGGIFNRGFVRAYARHLGLDEDQAVADYMAASGDAPASKVIEPEIAEAIETRSEQRRKGIDEIPWGVLATALLVVALGFAIWGFYSSEKEREAREAAPTASHHEEAMSNSQPSPAPPAPSANAQPATTEAHPAPVNPAPAVASAIQPAATEGEFVLLIKAADDSWMSIKADGLPVMEGTLVGGTEKSVRARNSIDVHAGNVGALDFFFNGKKLPPQGDTGEVKNLSFNDRGLEPPQPAAPAAGETALPPH